LEFDWPVLIIDGNRDKADFVRYSLVDAGWDARRVQWTDTLAGARSHLRRGTPRVIVTALSLPDAPDETKLLDALREDAPDVPIVGVAPNTPLVDTVGSRGGAHAYVSQQEIDHRLVAAIRTAVARLRFERQLRADQAADLDRRQSDIIGRLADDAAFEVNNALAIVSAALTRLESSLQAHPAHRDTLSAAREGVARAARAMDGLLAAGGRRAMSKQPVDVRALLERERDRLNRAAGPQVDVDTWVVPGMPPILGDASALAQVLGLLVGRAGADMEDGGEVVIRAEVAADGQMAEILLLDDGPPPAVGATPRQADILRARSLVEQNGGSLDISARWPTGVQARVRLPLARAASGKSAPETSPDKPNETRPVVLVVEDERLLQGLLVRALHDHGYFACAASNEEEARAEANRLGHVDVVVTDVVLPKGDLAAMLRDLRKRWPKLAIVLMTGAVAQAAEPLARAGIDAPVLAKPFRLPELFSAVKLALDEVHE
jgi:two-component system cell cycle sensor histidine kinase/response regulator CckA